MRSFCLSSAVLLLVCCSLAAKAVIIRNQDPQYTTVRSTPSAFSFTPCPTTDPYYDKGSTISADGCFGGVNETGSTITSMTLSFSGDAALADSGANGVSSDIFSQYTFSAPADPTAEGALYTFSFSGGTGLIVGETFVITEDGVSDLSQFPTVTLTYTNASTTTTVTPEPSSELLFATGLLGLGGLYVQRRRRA